MPKNGAAYPSLLKVSSWISLTSFLLTFLSWVLNFEQWADRVGSGKKYHQKLCHFKSIMPMLMPGGTGVKRRHCSSHSCLHAHSTSAPTDSFGGAALVLPRGWGIVSLGWAVSKSIHISAHLPWGLFSWGSLICSLEALLCIASGRSSLLQCVSLLVKSSFSSPLFRNVFGLSWWSACLTSARI